MKKIIAFILIFALVLTGCATPIKNEVALSSSDTVSYSEAETAVSIEQQKIQMPEINFLQLDDPDLLGNLEDNVYSELVANLDSDAYFVENVSALYISNEYLEELAYNSQANIYFGYTLAELEEIFQSSKYVFTLGEDGQTAVQAFEEYDDTYDQIIRNVAVGTGVILICVTVSVVSAAGAPAVSVIFAASAKTGTIISLSSGALSAVAAGIVSGIETKDFEEAMKAAALAGSTGFKWGAISGVIEGGISESIALKGATLNGLTLNEAARIQQESKYPLFIIKQFKSIDEYLVYKNAGLKGQMVGGRMALVQDIELNYRSLFDGTEVTNMERMQLGSPPLDPETGLSYNLHHIGQKSDATLAVLKATDHQVNSSILHVFGKKSEISRNNFSVTRKQFWKEFAELYAD